MTHYEDAVQKVDGVFICRDMYEYILHYGVFWSLSSCKPWKLSYFTSIIREYESNSSNSIFF